MKYLNIIFRLSFVFLLSIIVFSCSNRDDDNLIEETTSVKIDSVKIPQAVMAVFDIQTITTYSDFNLQCEGFYGYDYLYTGEFDRTVTAYKFKTNSSCTTVAARASKINFKPQKAGTYLFKFWNGKNGAGADLWIEKTVMVN